MDHRPSGLSYLLPVGDGIHAVDTGFHRDRFDAAYLVVDAGRAAFVDTGTNLAVPRLLAALQALGLGRDAVDWIIPTHVHLDHAGGVGLLAQALPAARVLVHPRGARHLIDPTQLYEGALAVYGQAEMERSYGVLQPVPAERVLSSSDGQQLPLGGRLLSLLHTPGHAKHHHCIWDARTRGWFTGDTFGLSYPEFMVDGRPWILPTSTPVQFEPEVLEASIERLLSWQPACMYLTHFGRVGEVERLARVLHDQLREMVALGQRLRRVPQRHEALKQGLLPVYLASLRAHGCDMPEAQVAELLSVDLELNAQGLGVWLDRLDREAAQTDTPRRGDGR